MIITTPYQFTRYLGLIPHSTTLFSPLIHTEPDGPGGYDYAKLFNNLTTKTITFRMDSNGRGRARARARINFGVDSVFDRSVRQSTCIRSGIHCDKLLAAAENRCPCSSNAPDAQIPTQVVIFNRVEVDADTVVLQPLFCGNFIRRAP